MKKILLVEDDPDIMCINAAALRMRKYDVLQAFTLEEADRAVESHNPDMMVLDVVLPDGNGLEFCSRIKKKSNIPILFLSGLCQNSDVVEGFRAGGDDYLTKPYSLEVLVSRIEARLRNPLMAAFNRCEQS